MIPLPAIPIQLGQILIPFPRFSKIHDSGPDSIRTDSDSDSDSMVYQNQCFRFQFQHHVILINSYSNKPGFDSDSDSGIWFWFWNLIPIPESFTTLTKTLLKPISNNCLFISQQWIRKILNFSDFELFILPRVRTILKDFCFCSGHVSHYPLKPPSQCITLAHPNALGSTYPIYALRAIV